MLLKEDQYTAANSLIVARELRELFMQEIRPALQAGNSTVDTDKVMDMINRIIWGLHQPERPESLPAYKPSLKDKYMLNKMGIKEQKKLDAASFIKSE